MSKKNEVPVKMPEQILGGVYANQMMISHTREEFVLDYINLFPPTGVVNARVIVSPGHLKRMIRALTDNLARYEKRFGQVAEAAAPQADEFMN